MLKWIYNLGVQHENLRIRKLIVEFQKQKQDEYAIFNERYQNPSKSRPALSEERQIAVNQEALDILNRLLKPQDEFYVTHAPIDVERPQE